MSVTENRLKSVDYQFGPVIECVLTYFLWQTPNLFGGPGLYMIIA